MDGRSETEFWNSVSEIDDHYHQGVPTIDSLSIPFMRSSDLHFLEALGSISSSTILEVGCGFGDLSLLLGQEGGDVIGLDIANGMVKKAMKRADSTGIPATFVLGDAKQLPFRDGSMDMIIGMRAIHHFPDLPLFFREVRRVLKPTGQAVFIEPQKKNPFVEFNRRILHPELRTIGEHPLVQKDIDDARAVFPNIQVETFFLLSPLAFLFSYLIRWDAAYRAAYEALQRIDDKVAKKTFLRPYCWQVLLVLRRS